jgi:hypothetical protein
LLKLLLTVEEKGFIKQLNFAGGSRKGKWHKETNKELSPTDLLSYFARLNLLSL